MNKKLQTPSWIGESGDPASAPKAASTETAAPAASHPPVPPAAPASVPTLSTFPRDPRFVVLLDERLPRHDTVVMQVAVPKDIHQRLRYESLGSMNQVLMGLVRYALQTLDENKETLKIER